jgi:hypothetical protein
MMRLLFLLVLLTLFAPAAQAQMTITFAENGGKVDLVTDGKGKLRLVAPIPGTYHYDASRALLLARAADSNTGPLFLVAPMAEGRTLPEAALEKVGAGPVIAGFETIQWRIKVGRFWCGEAFTSPKAAQVIGLDYADLTRMNIGLSVLRAARTGENPCDFFLLPKGLGKLVGFPMSVQRKDTASTVVEIRQAQGDLNWPDEDDALQLTPEGRQSFLELMLPREVQDAFRRSGAQLPPDAREKALEILNHQHAP